MGTTGDAGVLAGIKVIEIGGLGPAPVVSSIQITPDSVVLQVGDSIGFSVVSGSSPTGTEIYYTLGAGSNMPAGQWTKWVLELGFGNVSQGQSPSILIMRNGIDVTPTAARTANLGQIGDENYGRIGYYRWNETSYGGLASLAAYRTNNYYEAGGGKTDRALASLVGIP